MLTDDANQNEIRGGAKFVFFTFHNNTCHQRGPRDTDSTSEFVQHCSGLDPTSDGSSDEKLFCIFPSHLCLLLIWSVVYQSFTTAGFMTVYSGVRFPVLKGKNADTRCS